MCARKRNRDPEELMDRKSEPAPDAKDGAKEIGTRAEVCDLAQELRGVSLFLERVTVVERADNLDGIGHQLPALPFPL